MSLVEEGQVAQCWFPAWFSGSILGLLLRGGGQKYIATLFRRDFIRFYAKDELLWGPDDRM